MFFQQILNRIFRRRRRSSYSRRVKAEVLPPEHIDPELVNQVRMMPSALTVRSPFEPDDWYGTQPAIYVRTPYLPWHSMAAPPLAWADDEWEAAFEDADFIIWQTSALPTDCLDENDYDAEVGDEDYIVIHHYVPELD
jgi:hypothetical protein